MASSGTMTQTVQDLYRGPSRPVCRVELDWTSTSGGAVSQPVSIPLSGQILRVVFIPGTSSAQPSNNYAVTLLTPDGLDVLANQGAALSNTTATTVCPGVTMTDGTHITPRPVAVGDQLTLTVASAGNAKSGTVVLYLQ